MSPLSNLYLFYPFTSSFFFFSTTATVTENIRSLLIFVFRITKRKDRSRIRSFVKINFKKCIFVKDLRKDTSTIEFVSIMYVTI